MTTLQSSCIPESTNSTVTVWTVTIQAVTSYRNIPGTADSSDAIVTQSNRILCVKLNIHSYRCILTSYGNQSCPCTHEQGKQYGETLDWLTFQCTSLREMSPLPKRSNLRVPQGRRILRKNETAPFPPTQHYIFGFAYWNTKSYNSKRLEPPV